LEWWNECKATALSIDSSACRAYAERAGAVLDRRVAEEGAR
jgi:hypothetical protein